MKKLLFYLILFISALQLISCQSKPKSSFRINRDTPKETVNTLIEFARTNNKNIELFDSIAICNKSELDFLLSSRQEDKISKKKIKLDFFDILSSDSINTIIRVKISTIDSLEINDAYDKLFYLTLRNQKWLIEKISDFSYGKPTELNEFEALSVVYGAQNDKFERDSGYRSPILHLSIGNKYFLMSTLNIGDGSGVGVEQIINGAILQWNGINWNVENKKDSITSSIDSNHGGINAEIAYFQKDNSPFFLLCDYQEGEFGSEHNYLLLGLNLNKIYTYKEEVIGNLYAFGDDNEEELERKVEVLPINYKYYTYKDGYYLPPYRDYDCRFRVDENKKEIYLEVWYKDHKEIMAEGGLKVNPKNPENLIKDGYWYDKSIGFKGTYYEGRLLNNNIMNAFRDNHVEKCQWCKMGVIINGYCDLCGTPSPSTRASLNDKINSHNSAINIMECKNRMNHNTLRYPEECPLCGFQGLIR